MPVENYHQKYLSCISNFFLRTIAKSVRYTSLLAGVYFASRDNPNINEITLSGTVYLGASFFRFLSEDAGHAKRASIL